MSMGLMDYEDVTHPLILGLFDTPAGAAAAARELRNLGIPRDRVSIVAQNHDAEGDLAQASGASPGSEIEDSRLASRLGELGAHLIAAVAVVLPGIGPIVADGPLAAGLGEADGHLAGGVGRALEHAGLSSAVAEDWERRVNSGAVIVGAHTTTAATDDVRAALTRGGASNVAEGRWGDRPR
jgi:hypothetical protein